MNQPLPLEHLDQRLQFEIGARRNTLGSPGPVVGPLRPIILRPHEGVPQHLGLSHPGVGITALLLIGDVGVLAGDVLAQRELDPRRSARHQHLGGGLAGLELDGGALPADGVGRAVENVEHRHPTRCGSIDPGGGRVEHVLYAGHRGNRQRTFVDGIAHQVGVRIDNPRHHELARGVDHSGTGRCREPGPDRGDLAATQQQVGAGEGAVGDRQHGRVPDHGDRRRALRREGWGDGDGREQRPESGFHRGLPVSGWWVGWRQAQRWCQPEQDASR